MLIHTICKQCGLTKKAVIYYEKQGLIRPKTAENGYREYSDADAAILREIAMLRKLGLSVADAKAVLTSADKSAALQRWRDRTAIQLNETRDRLACADRLIERYDVDKGLRELNALRSAQAIIERLSMAFPGAYGRFIALHFGQFLTQPIRTAEQAAAYDAIVRYLDELVFPAELEAYCEQALGGLSDDDFARMIDAISAAACDYGAFLHNNRDILEEYIPYRLSDEFESSEAGHMRRLMLDFQQQSGYAEQLIKNLIILSPAYAEYQHKMQAANEQLIAQYPQAAELES